jgi:nitrite reductase (NO-forming)
MAKHIPFVAGMALLALSAAAWPTQSRAAGTHGAHEAAGAAAHAHGTAAAAPHAHAHPAENGSPDAPIDVVRRATDLPAPLKARGPRRIKIDLDTVEVTGQLADGATYHYWTFNRKVPGPFVRVRVGDTVEVRLRNQDDSAETHNVDFHAVTGPGGGASATDAKPGETRSFEFKALNPGLYVYHCAVPSPAQHIANGMYGMILVEPEGGLPKVDREFYVMQGEIYTQKPYGSRGHLEESRDKLLAERPEYFVFNGTTDALKTSPLKAKVGETARIYFGVGGPNYTSSFHVIGEIFDKVYTMGSLTTQPLRDVQTITTPPGGASVVDFKLEVPGKYVLVDHALSRVERGLAGILEVEGPDNPAVFRDHNPQRTARSGGH